jgi:hypothetical protein
VSVYTQVPQSRADLDRLSDRVKALFVRYKTRQLGRPYKLQARFSANEELWMNGARICLEYQLSPADLMEALFTYNQVPGGPFPNQLGGTAIASQALRYKRTHTGMEEKWAEKFTYFTNYLRTLEHNSNGRVRPHVALTQLPYRTDVDPVLACCLLPSPGVLHWHGDLAYDLIVEDPALEEVLRTLGKNLSWMDTIKHNRERNQGISNAHTP